MILLLLGGLGGDDNEGDANSFMSFFGGSAGLLTFIQGLFNAIAAFLGQFPSWITGAPAA